MEVAFLCGGGIRMYKPWNWFTLVLMRQVPLSDPLDYVVSADKGNVLAWFCLMGRKYG